MSVAERRVKRSFFRHNGPRSGLIMAEKSSDSNVWLARRRRDGQTGVAEPCSAQLRVDAPKARQRFGHLAADDQINNVKSGASSI